jgi:acyl-CoA thioesterase I
MEEDSVRYVALGDSYTIGTSVAPEDRWPNQLASRITELELVANPAVNGYTSADLLRHELAQLDVFEPGFVTVLIGVNDVVQGISPAAYATNVAVIVDDLVARLPPDRIVCLATPDYTRTPRGADFGNRVQRREGIERVNAILRDACDRHGIAFVAETFEVSQLVAEDVELVADDGLHPSAAQYRLWVDAIEPVVRRLLVR